MFSSIVVLLNFLKYRRSVVFPKIVVSAFAGFVLNLCHYLSCLMTGSRFWYFCNICSVIFSFGGKKTLSTSNFESGIVSSGSWRSKTWFTVYFGSYVSGPDNFILSVRFSFSIKVKGSFFCVVVVLFSFVEYCSLSNVNLELV